MKKSYFTNTVGKYYWDFDWLRFDLERRFNPPIPVDVIFYISIGIKKRQGPGLTLKNMEELYEQAKKYADES